MRLSSGRANRLFRDYYTHSYVDMNGRYQFCWSDSEKQLVLGAFFYGYFVLQIPGGALAEKIGAKAVLGWTVLLTALLSLITPTVAFQGPAFLIALRVVQGLLSGVTYPALPPLIKRYEGRSILSKFVVEMCCILNVQMVLCCRDGQVHLHRICGWHLWDRPDVSSGRIHTPTL